MTGFITDKVEPHGYLTDYLRLAAQLPRDACVCEIGVEHGSSLVLWQHLFPASPAIVGVDRRDEDEMMVWPEGTRKVVSEQDNPTLPALVKGFSPGGFHLIVDDASHIGSLTLTTFGMLWPLVKPGGFYVVEDWADPWVFPDWIRWPALRPELAGDELVDKVPELITALKDGAETVTYTRLGLVIIQKAA
jgi:hypothetical protein